MNNQPKKKILIVEDDRALQNALVEMIGREGFETMSAFDGEEAVEKIKEIKPALILLDIVLPKKDGYDVLEEVRKNEETKSIPVLILTNLEEIDSVQRALDLGATTFMVKSDFSLKDVVEKVKETLKKSNIEN